MDIQSLRLTDISCPAIMGIINVSPDSFYAPCGTPAAALKLAEKMIAEGADLLDIGGEATNPRVQLGVDSPSWQEEHDRVIPVIQAIKRRFDIPLSVDTSSPQVMKSAISEGVDMINDQRALTAEGALTAGANASMSVCLMHFFQPLRTPGSSDKQTLLNEIKDALQARIAVCEKAGISRNRLFIDPGFGQGNYGKNAAENYYLLQHQNQRQH